MKAILAFVLILVTCFSGVIFIVDPVMNKVAGEIFGICFFVWAVMTFVFIVKKVKRRW